MNTTNAHTLLFEANIFTPCTYRYPCEGMTHQLEKLKGIFIGGLVPDTKLQSTGTGTTGILIPGNK